MKKTGQACNMGVRGGVKAENSLILSQKPRGYIMKKVSLLLVLAGIWLAACQKNSESLSPQTEANDFESVVESAARLAVTSDSVTLGICKGKLTEVAAEDLPAEVTAYIDSAYAGANITYAAKDQSGKIIVAITLADGSVKGLLFDADGTFKAELKQHVKKAKLTRIEVSALPANVTSYVASNYAGAEIKLAATNDAGEYYVGILLDGKVKILLFNADGSFDKELEKPAFGRGHKRH